MTTGTIHRSSRARSADQGEEVRYGGRVIGSTADVKGIGAKVREQGVPPLDQLKARNNQKRKSSPIPSVRAPTTVKKVAPDAQQSEARAQLAARTARIRSQQGQRRQQGQGGGAAPGQTGGGQQQQQGQPSTLLGRILRGGRNAVQNANQQIERRKLQPPGGAFLPLTILLFFLFIVVRTGAQGKYSRAQLLLLTVLARTSLVPISSGGSAGPQDTTTAAPAVAGLSADQLAAATSPTVQSPREAASNTQLVAQGIRPVQSPPRPTRLPPTIAPLS